MDMATPALPDDIIRSNILTRLPVKYLLRFRPVCKSWNSLIYETSFIRDHLNCTTRMYSNLIFKKHAFDGIDHATPYLGDIAILSLSDLSETRLFDAVSYHARNIDMLGSINGIVCLSLWNVGKFILWNPAIRQAMEIDSPITNIMFPHVIPAFYGLCWDAMENDFKVVYSCYTIDMMPIRSCHIYSCNSGSWSLLPNIMPNGSSFRPLGEIPSAIVNGIPYWKQYGIYTKNILIFKFDVGSKEFRWLPELEVASGHDHILVNLKECLSALVYKVQSSRTLVDVHCFDERCGVWSKMYNFRGPIFDRVLSCFKHGGELVFLRQERFCCYDTRTDKIMDLDNQEGSIWECFSYSESLIFLKGMKPQHQVHPVLWK